MLETNHEGFCFKGVIEGFYGEPWTHSERINMINWLGEQGYNSYLYAPKYDQYHRTKWRVPYPKVEMDRFKELIQASQESQINFMLAISPGLSLKYAESRELDTMWDKMKRFIEIGVRTFGLFYDDIPLELQHEIDREKYQDLAHAQSDFTHRLWERCKEEGIHLIVCPTHYCTNPDVPYLNALGKLLDPSIDIFWSGPTVCSQMIPEEHLEKVAYTLKRRPLIWDNFPVNDIQMTSEMHIGSYTGRDKSLVSHTKGVFLNPMNQPYSTRIALGTAARFFKDPERYDAVEARKKVICQLIDGTTNTTLNEAFLKFSEAVTISPLTPEEPPLFVKFVDDWNQYKMNGQNKEAIHHMKEQSEMMLKTYSELQSYVENYPILIEMKPWIEDYGNWAKALEVSSRIMLERDQFDQYEDEIDRLNCQQRTVLLWNELANYLADSVIWPTRTCGDVLRIFLLNILRHTRHVIES